MKNTLTIFVALFMIAATANAQLIRTSDLETYAKNKYGDKWNDAALNLASTLELDKNNSLTYIQVIDCGNKTKEQLYVMLNYWATASFNDDNSSVKLNDKELGCIIIEGYLSNIASHRGGLCSYIISVRPIIKIDIKDTKIRVTFTVQNYDARVLVGDGSFGSLITGDAPPTEHFEKWGLDRCYPFVRKDSHKKTSSKALIMTHAFSNVLMDKIEEAVKNGIVGNEDDNW